jgi:hypothetical protein
VRDGPAAALFREVVQFAARVLEFGDNAFDPAQQCPARAGDADTPAVTFEEGDPVMLFEPSDTAAQGRLRNRQRIRRPAEMLFLCCGSKVAQRVDIHAELSCA